MKPFLRDLLAVFLIVATGTAAAMSPASAPGVVEAVQAPAWLERAGQSRPLAAGTELADGDTIRTGDDARALLRLADGSTVKLGAGAVLRLYSRSLDPRRQFRGALDVAAGAFRYTTGKLRRLRARELTLRVGTATIGIRGTDIWGKSTRERDIVALLDGRIDVTRGGESFALDTPLTWLDAPRDGTVSLRELDRAQLATWARETEIERGDGAANRKGTWVVRVTVETREVEALALYDALRAAGWAARLLPLANAGGTWRYAVLLTGFADEREAAAAAARLKADRRFGVYEAVPTR